MAYFRPSIETLTAYQPGEQPDPSAKIIKLNTNENPYPPSDRAVAALRAVHPDDLRRYPQPAADEFRESAASVLGLDPDWICVGNGSDDLLTMLFRSVAGAARPVAFPVPTYVLYRTLATIQDAPVVEVPFDDSYSLPVDALVSAGAALTIVASPNSPSGNRFTNTDLLTLATKTSGVLAIDEAYVEFASGDALELTQRCTNVIVLRTLSKSHSLAGWRVGFASGNRQMIAALTRIKSYLDYGMPQAIQIGAITALRGPQDCVTENAETYRVRRDVLVEGLGQPGPGAWKIE